MEPEGLLGKKLQLPTNDGSLGMEMKPKEDFLTDLHHDSNIGWVAC